MKKISKSLSAFLVVLLLLSALGATALADDGGNTTLTTTVPCTVTLQVGDHGKVTVDGAAYTGNASLQRETGAAVTYVLEPEDGYELDKVTYNGAEVTAEVSNGRFTAPALGGNAALSVSFKPVPVLYTVTFKANGHGSAPASQTVESGKTAAKPADPAATGWKFGGWFTDKNGKTAYDFSKPVTANLTLYAKWTRTASTGGADSPKTGDESRLGLWLALAAVSGCGLVGLAVFGKKRRRRRE